MPEIFCYGILLWGDLLPTRKRTNEKENGKDKNLVM